MTHVPKSFKNRTGAVLEAVAKVLNQAEGGFPSCLNCDHFTEREEVCRLAGQRPPAMVIAFGCSSFVPEPPF